MKITVLSFLGTQLDSGRGAGRWGKWRPNISLVQQPDHVVDHLVLFHLGASADLLQLVTSDIAQVSPATRVEPVQLAIQDPWDFAEVYGALFDFARRWRFNTEQHRYWVHITTGTHVAQICLFLLTEARYLPGQLLQSSPPRRQREGQIGDATLIDLDLSRYDKLATRFAQARAEAVSELKSGIATKNPAFNAMIEEIERVAERSKAPMLLMGPTGAGKSFLARQVFALKKARHQLAGRFVEVNCATIKGDQAMSTLFGHAKGAFTGAAGERAGLLKAADGGLLFLDEIGELGGDEQAMLLKAVEEKRFFPMGSDREVASDFQLIAGTNLDLRRAVAQGQFREDLYARINLWAYTLPGLAQRSEDIAPNVQFELKRIGQELNREITFNREAERAYLSFATSNDAPWHGNFRDLSASLSRLATLADGNRITESEVAAEVLRLKRQWLRPDDAEGEPGAPHSALSTLMAPAELATIDPFDQVQLAYVVSVCQQSRSLSDAGRTLFSASRERRSTTNDGDRVRKYLARFGLDWARLA